MEQSIASPFAAWGSFYVITGSASAALIGLQFVVMVLSAQINTLGDETTTRAFATPTIVHFCTVLFVAALLSAPWPTLGIADIALGICAVAGVVYTATVVRHTRRQTDYAPVLEDWIFHGVLPLIAYIGLMVAAAVLPVEHEPSLFAIGAALLVLLFVGIHNAWDAVVYIAHRRPQ